MKKHFVTFYSPGTFLSESTEKPIDSWDVNLAKKMAKTIKERHGSTPYGFMFSTRSRGENDLDSKVSKKSGMYYLNAKVETYEEVIARNDPKEEILRSNMRINGYKKIVTNAPGSKTYRFCFPLEKGDVVL
jgi:hypothetical protein